MSPIFRSRPDDVADAGIAVEHSTGQGFTCDPSTLLGISLNVAQDGRYLISEDGAADLRLKASALGGEDF